MCGCRVVFWSWALLVGAAFPSKALAAGQDAPPQALAEEILRTAGVMGGLVVHVGCRDARLTAALRAGDAYIVHGLDTDAAAVAKAREFIASAGRYGPVSVDIVDGQHLPYIDNLVNLLVAEDLGGVPMSEVMRVLAPGGAAYVKTGGRWMKTVKPRPAEIDDWTHFLHGPDNNALAEDRVVGPPRHMQWLSEPTWTRNHSTDKKTYPTVRAVVSAQGRLFYVVDETPSSNMRVPSTWFLAARDGFSGVLLWKKRLDVTTFEYRLEGVWRMLVADGNRVYASLGADRPLSALDAATGKVVRDYPDTAGFQEMIKDGGRLFLVGRQNDIRALDADAGALLWRWAPDKDDPLVPLTLAAADGKVFVKTDLGVWCFSACDGRTLWRRALPTAQKRVQLAFPRERLIVKDGVVLVSFGGNDPAVLNKDLYAYLGSHPRVQEYGGKLAALSAKDGALLWQAPYLPGLESTPAEMYVSAGVVWTGPDFAEPRDLRTGAVKQTRPVIESLWTDGHHYRCYPGKATCRYIITAKRGIEMIDLQGDNHSRNNWARGTCRVGVTPCNGLIYAPPHSCGCYMEAKLFGFWALAPERHPGPTDEPATRLEKGPAYPSEIGRRQPQTGDPTAWPTYRHDAARSGTTSARVPSNLSAVWSANIGGTLSPPVVVDGRVVIADIDAHRVVCLEAKTGAVLWSFTCGGRVDSPPTLSNGLVLFGSADGWVYCLRASDGRLAWRFLAALGTRRAVACEQVESLWPVHGSVLVAGGVAYVSAGRSSYLDNGIVLYGLDPETGTVRCTSLLKSDATGVLDPPPADKRQQMAETIRQNQTDYKTFLAADRSDAFAMQGALTDVMTADGQSIFMRQLRFDSHLIPQPDGRQHLFSTGSLLDGWEHNRAYWVLGTGDFNRLPVAYPWIMQTMAVPHALMMAFDDKTVWGVERGGGGRGPAYALFAAPRPDPSDAESRLPDFRPRTSKPKAGAGPSWTAPLTLRPRAMLGAGQILFVAGENTGQDGGCVRAVSAADGKTLADVRLASPPVWDGAAATAGRLYLSTVDGKVVCLGGR
jgi:outer membrane protein assembly factor BamB